MNKHIRMIVCIAILALTATSAANAHDVRRYGYDRPGDYRSGLMRPKHMPVWLKRNKYFRHWYKRTPLRRNRHLAWWQLYFVFLEERRYATRQYSRLHDHYGSLRYDWERRQWQRRNDRRRYRDDDRSHDH